MAPWLSNRRRGGAVGQRILTPRKSSGVRTGFLAKRWRVPCQLMAKTVIPAFFS